MRKKLISFILALTLALPFVPPALALGAFADVADEDTARSVETLRLMGVIEGDANGSFRPNSSLTRAEFCKMTVVLTGKRGVIARYGSRTVFPDVKASHWASGYVNYAASKDAGLLHGMPDGTFAPDRPITGGEAAAILVRLLGYTDADAGGIWPDGYLALAGETGMTKGVSVSGGAAITRAQAAKLFVGALSAKNGKGETLLSILGYTADLSKDPVTLYAVDTVKGVLRLSDGTTPAMESPMASTALVGVKGWVVTNAAGKAVTFLPSTGAAGVTVGEAAVIVRANGSTAGFDALTGGAGNYRLYRNGVPAAASALRQNDVVTYDAASNSVHACDTRIGVYYESCEPSQTAPVSITALGGTRFYVLPTAQQSLSEFKPGRTMTLLLSADGRVAGAVESGAGGISGNAFAYVDAAGKVSLICGGSLYQLACSGAGYEGEVVRVSQNNTAAKGGVYLSRQSGGAGGVLDLTAMSLGAYKLAAGVLVFHKGVLTSLSALGVSRVEQERIAYARTNNAGEVDLIVIKDNSNALYGRAVVTTETRTDSITGVRYESRFVAVNYGNGKQSKAIETGHDVADGAYVEAVPNGDSSRYISLTMLTKLAAVPASAWIGDTALNYGGRTYIVYPDSVLCYNRDSGAWFESLAAAKAYGGTMDCYVKDGVVRAVELRS